MPLIASRRPRSGRSTLTLVVRQQRGAKLVRHRAVQQPVAVLGKGGGVLYRVLDAEPDKPAEQQIVIDPLN